MNRLLSALALMAVVGGCSPGMAAGCPAGMDRAALDHLAPSLGSGPSDISVWMGQDNAASLDALERKVKTFRARVAKITDPCSRHAYTQWLDWYETEIADGRSELKDHHQARDMAAYYADEKREVEQAREAHIRDIP